MNGRRLLQSATIGAILALVISLTMASCVAQRVQQNTLEPAMQAAWTAIEVQAVRGGLPQELADAFRAALRERDFVAVASVWPEALAAAERDIDARLAAGVIGPGVARSLRERLIRFTEGVALITGRLNE